MIVIVNGSIELSKPQDDFKIGAGFINCVYNVTRVEYCNSRNQIQRV